MQEVIVDREQIFSQFERKNINNERKEIELASNFKNVLDEVYDDLRTEIKEKDTIIRELSIRV